MAISQSQKAVHFLQGFLKKFQKPNSGIPRETIWQLISTLISCQTQTAMGFEKLGIIRETCYFMEEGCKVAETSQCSLRLAAILAFDAEVRVKMGDLEKSAVSLKKCHELIKGLNLHDLNVMYYAHSAILSLQRQKLFSQENEYYTLSDQVFTDLKQKSHVFSITEIAEKISRLSISKEKEKEAANKLNSTVARGSAKTRVRTTRRQVISAKPSRPVATQKSVPTKPVQVPSRLPETQQPSEIFGIEVVWNSIVRSQVYSLGLQNSVENAISLLDGQYHSAGLRDQVLLDVFQAWNLYLLAKRELYSDAVFSFLSDSAISIPSTLRINNLTKDINYPQKAIENLEKSLELILKNTQNTMKACNATEINWISSLLNTIYLYLAAIKPSDELIRNNLQPYPNLLYQELSRSLTLKSDRKVFKLKSSDYNWPTNDASLNNITEKLDSLEIETIEESFRNENFSRILPEKWAAVTVNVCSETGSLGLTRYEKNKAPFQLNLPLNRHTSRDANEGSYTFEYGLQQLKDIIQKSNFSASKERTAMIKTQQDRQEWWTERYDLDKQLCQLMSDVEYFWLGGFTGIFSKKVPVPHLLDHLTAQINTLLQTYLPSRRWLRNGNVQREKNRNKTKSRNQEEHDEESRIQVDIHSKITELFVGLGHPEGISDPGMLEDLIYYLFDILQFHGERNAYDEIDIDEFTVKIEAALTAYHTQAEEYYASNGANEIEHFVLILDKKSLGFCWESLPCLRNQSVSRAPSLSILADLLKTYYDPSVDPLWPIISAPPDNNNCHYILNPDKDLPKTQERFQSKFENLVGWSGKIGTEPTEKETAQMLEKGDIFVYMGHGSGQQYIRSAKIKSLKRCCCTVLLGCSSGVLTEAGDYDPWGTPVTYMSAGCPMLVANMWDVTDRDIDIFGTKMLEQWGVLMPEGGPLNELYSISEAVMRSRDECKLKYLNGSAPVIYGIPIKIRK